jgi:hypothetical protein
VAVGEFPLLAFGLEALEFLLILEQLALACCVSRLRPDQYRRADDRAAAVRQPAFRQPGLTATAPARRRTKAQQHPQYPGDWSECPAVESIPGKVSGA